MPRYYLGVLGLALPLATFSAEPPKVVERDISVSSFVDMGQIKSGSTYTSSGAETDIEDVFLARNGVALVYKGVLDNGLRMNIGVGGLFWKAYPETDNQSKSIQFGPGISEASAEYPFASNKHFKFGYFGYKYNEDAMNLGEYLLRSEAYPGMVNTGGWVWLNSAAYQSMGARFTWEMFDGKLRHDFLFFSEFSENPIFDFSPAYVATYKPNKVFEAGAGFSLHRWFPIKPSGSSPRDERNNYMVFEGVQAIPDTVIPGIADQRAFAGGTLRDMENHIRGYVDSAGNPLAQLNSDGRVAYIINGNDTIYPTSTKNLTFKAIKLMARASLNLGTLIDLEERQGPFKIFAEAAVLGLEDQPYYYEDITNRIPIMVGIHVPTFGLLDLLSFQYEYFNNPWPDDKTNQFDQSLPIPHLPGDNPAVYERNKADFKEDNTKWTVYAKRTLVPGLAIHGQVANDHFRSLDRFTVPTFVPVTNRNDHWYYLVRVSWNL
jgi:hypothetical protein